MPGTVSPKFRCKQAGLSEKVWWVQIEGDRLKAVDPDGWEHFFTRQALPEQLEYMDLPVGGGRLLLKRQGKTTLELPKRARKPVTDWIGPPTHAMLKSALRQGSTLSLVLGAFIAGAALIPAETPSAQYPDYTGLVLGSLFILSGILGQVVARPQVFLINVVVLVILLVDTVADIVSKELGYYWAALGVFLIWALQFELKRYFRFRSVKPPGPEDEAPDDGEPAARSEMDDLAKDAESGSEA